MQLGARHQDIGRWGTIFFDDYISEGWLQVLEKDNPGLRNWQEAFKKIYTSKSQKKNLQLLIFYEKEGQVPRVRKKATIESS